MWFYLKSKFVIIIWSFFTSETPIFHPQWEKAIEQWNSGAGTASSRTTHHAWSPTMVPGPSVDCLQDTEPSAPRDSFLFIPGALWLLEGCYVQLKCHSLEHPQWTSLAPEALFHPFFPRRVLWNSAAMTLCCSWVSLSLNWHSKFVYSFPKRAWFPYPLGKAVLWS